MYPGLRNDADNWSASERTADQHHSNSNSCNGSVTDQRDNNGSGQGQGHGAVGAGSSNSKSMGSVVIDWSLGFGAGVHSPFSNPSSTTVRVAAAVITTPPLNQTSTQLMHVIYLCPSQRERTKIGLRYYYASSDTAPRHGRVHRRHSRVSTTDRHTQVSECSDCRL